MKTSLASSIFLLLMSTQAMVKGFAPVSLRKRSIGVSSTSLFDIEHGREELLHSNLDLKVSKQTDKNKSQEVLAKEEKIDNKPSSDAGPIQEKVARLTQPRAYPLFLAEKTAEILESTFGGCLNALHLPVSWPTDSKFNAPSGKEKVVILGSGWGAVPFLKDIDTNRYDVICVSPRNHFLFTPMLAGASVGSVEFRSICEPIREINHQADFLEAAVTEIDPKTQTVTCQAVSCGDDPCDIEDFKVGYDRLIMTIGAKTNTYGIPGVEEHCFFLKQVEDARRIRTTLVNCFERAHLPNLTDEERKHILTFVVIGAGPAGVEFAAELRDFIEQDGPRYYPSLLKFVRIKVVEATHTILAPFKKSLQEEAVRQLDREFTIRDPKIRDLLPERIKFTELLLDSSVKEIHEDSIELNGGRVIKYGLAVWAAGNGPLPLTLQLIDALGEEQKAEQSVARGRIAVDPWLRAVGGNGRIFAYGDCSCITAQKQLPATAQVALQQGEFLAKLLNRGYNPSPPLTKDGLLLPPIRDPRHGIEMDEAIAGIATETTDFAKPFQFLNLGILAYTGHGSALAQVPVAPDGPVVQGTGSIGNAIWKSVYLTKQISWRNRLLVLNDWAKRRIFGRDITRF